MPRYFTRNSLLCSNRRMQNAFPARYTIKHGNDHRIYLPVRYGTDSNRFPLNNIPDDWHDGNGWTDVSSMQVFFGPQFSKDDAISNKGIAKAADEMHPKTPSLVAGLKLARETGTGSFGITNFSPEGFPAMNAFAAKALGEAVHGSNGTRRQADLEKLKNAREPKRGPDGRYIKLEQ